MGFFVRKLDYSSGNGALPWLNEDTYSPLSLPSPSVVLGPNIQLLEKEKKQGKLGHFLELTFSKFQETEDDDDIKKLVEKYLSILKNMLSPNLSSDGIQTVGNYVALGICMSRVESDSGLQIDNKTHPAVLNSMFSLRMDVWKDKELRELFSVNQNFADIIELAIRVGYVSERFKGKLSGHEMFTNFKAKS
jgi:hypothetical protein